MSKYNEIENQLQKIVYNNEIQNNIFQIQGNEIDNLLINKENLINQLFIDTADESSIKKWEDMFNIIYDNSKTIDERKNAIKTRILGYKTFTVKSIRDICDIFNYSVAFIQENVDPYVVTIKLISGNDFSQVKSFMEAIEDKKPAHLQFIYLYNVATWGDIKAAYCNYTALSSYKWEDFLVNGAGHGASSKTDLYELKMWNSDDVFNFNDFNYNFKKIDDLFGGVTGHTHNGIDGDIILSRDIIYYDDNGGTNPNMAIANLNTKAGTIEDKTQIVNIIGGDAVGTDKYSVLATKMNTIKQGIITALNTKGASLITTSSYEDIRDAIVTIPGTIIPAGTAIPAEVRAGKTFINSSGKQTGTAATKTNLIITPSSTQDIDISGIHDGTCKVKGEINLIPGNIKKGITICGVLGTMEYPNYVSGDFIDSVNITVNKDGNGNVLSYTVLA